MICGNDFTRQWHDELEAAAHVPTTGIRVVILHPRFTGPSSAPVYRNGTVRLPACLFDRTMDWERTWRHELQHAADDRSGLLFHITRNEAEARARAAESAHVLPCPCCGNRDTPKSGVQSVFTWGVRCEYFSGGCGLQVEVSIDPLTPEEALAEGILRWNRRTNSEPLLVDPLAALGGTVS